MCEAVYQALAGTHKEKTKQIFKKATWGNTYTGQERYHQVQEYAV